MSLIEFVESIQHHVVNEPSHNITISCLCRCKCIVSNRPNLYACYKAMCDKTYVYLYLFSVFDLIFKTDAFFLHRRLLSRTTHILQDFVISAMIPYPMGSSKTLYVISLPVRKSEQNGTHILRCSRLIIKTNRHESNAQKQIMSTCTCIKKHTKQERLELSMSRCCSQ